VGGTAGTGGVGSFAGIAGIVWIAGIAGIGGADVGAVGDGGGDGASTATLAVARRTVNAKSDTHAAMTRRRCGCERVAPGSRIATMRIRNDEQCAIPMAARAGRLTPLTCAATLSKN
jgi:hypothetical protein